MKTTNVSGSASPFFFFLRVHYLVHWGIITQMTLGFHSGPDVDDTTATASRCSLSNTLTQWWRSNQFSFQGTTETEAEEEQLYQVLIGQESAPALLHSAGRPPLSRDVPTFIRQNLRKGCPAVVWLVERAVRPAWCPVGRLPGDGVLSKCCLQTHTHTQLMVQCLWCVL